MNEHPSIPACPGRRNFLKGLLAGLPAVLAAPSLLAAAPRRLPPLSLKFISAKLPLTPRAGWAARPPNPGRLRTASLFTRITIHHSGATVLRDSARSAVVTSLNGILDAHTRLRYGDIGYHLIVDFAGRVWEGRSLSFEGAHVSGANPANIGIMLLGNFEKQLPSAAQLKTLPTLVTLLRGQFDISARRVYGHRDIGSSVCPGRHLYPHVAAIQSSRRAVTPA